MEIDLTSLRISEAEDDSLHLVGTKTVRHLVYKHCFVGCFATSSVIHFSSMRNTLANVWHPLGGVQIFDLRNKRFLFRFSTKSILRGYFEAPLERSITTYWYSIVFGLEWICCWSYCMVLSFGCRYMIFLLVSFLSLWLGNSGISLDSMLSMMLARRWKECFRI